MNILYIDHYAGSISMGMEFRPYYFAKEWEKLGHNVRIIAAEFSHLRKNNPAIKKNFDTIKIDGIEFQLIKTRKYSGNGIKRAMSIFDFCSKLWINAEKISKDFNPDIIIASSTYPMDTYPAQRIKRFTENNAILVHEIHDMWPATLIEMYGMSPKHPFVGIVQMGENSFCRNADKVVSVLPNASPYLVEHGMTPGKFEYIANGVVLEDWDCPEPLPEQHAAVLKKAHEQGKFVIGFFGSHTLSYNLDVLLKAVKKCDAEKLFLAFVGSGIYKNELMDLAHELNLPDNCYAFLPPVNKQAIPSLINSIDASYISIKKNGLNRFGIGMNKIFDAMMGGKPIIYAADDPANLVKKYNCGVSVAPENAENLKISIEEMINMPEEERNKMGSNGKEAVKKFFNYPSLAKQFIDFLTLKGSD